MKLPALLPLTKQSSQLRPLLLLAGLAAVMWFGERMLAAPQAPTDVVAEGEFSAQRALLHVERIARQSHPTGSLANAQVRDYLVETLQGLGGEVEVQRRLQSYDYKTRSGQGRFASIENVVARWPGRESGLALLLMAHYDSVPHGPGAGDNASGVATVLETVRALAATGLPMRNPLTVLFTDGEEVGLIGAQAFFGHHRWAEETALVLNFDSRGSRGPAFMYETSEHNSVLIDALARVAPAPTASSLVHSIFQHMPNFTDLSIATAAGRAGMNFAFIDGFSDYHSPTDTAQRLSLDSLQHLGSFVLPLARHFGEAPLPVADLPNRHYFNSVGHSLINYAQWIDWLVWLLAASLLSVASVQALRRDAFSLLELLRGIGSALLLVAVPALLVLLLDRLLDQAVTVREVLARQRIWFAAWSLLAAGTAVWLQGALRAGVGWASGLLAALLLSGLAMAGGVSWPLLAVTISVGSLLALLLKRPLAREAWIAGGLWLLLLLALAAVLQLAGGAHILLWPLLACTLLQAWRWYHVDQASGTAPLAYLLAGTPAAVLLGATALTFDLLIGYAMPVVSVVPLLLLLLFYAPLFDSESARTTGFGVALLGVIVLGWLALNPPWSVEQPEPVALFVLHDAGEQRSYWASKDQQLTEWHRVVLGRDPQLDNSALFQPDSVEPLWLAPLEGVTVAAPQLELLAADNIQRRLRLRIRPSVAGDTLIVWLPADANLRGWQVDHQSLHFEPGGVGDWSSLSGFALPAAGVELTLDLGPGAHWPEIVLVDVHNELPDGVTVPLRSDTQMRGRNAYSDSTVTVSRVSVDELLDGKRIIHGL